MNKQLLFKLNEKTDLNESVSIDEDEPNEIFSKINEVYNEPKLNKLKPKYKMSHKQNLNFDLRHL